MRIQVNLADNLVSKIDRLAEQIGLSRSAVCAYWIGQSYMAFENGESPEDSLNCLYEQLSFTDLDDFNK